MACKIIEMLLQLIYYTLYYAVDEDDEEEAIDASL
jgi:hypothetical protein